MEMNRGTKWKKDIEEHESCVWHDWTTIKQEVYMGVKRDKKTRHTLLLAP